jgi:ArsR family transcriptional regulator
MEENDALAALTALAHPQRLRVYRQLVGAGPDGLTPGELCALLGLPASTLSFHLRGLLDGALVDQQRQGRQLRYRPRLAQMQALLDYLSAHCCDGAGCAELDPRFRGDDGAARVAGRLPRRAPDCESGSCADPDLSKEAGPCTS